MCKEIFEIKSYTDENGKEIILNYFLTARDSHEGQSTVYGIEADMVSGDVVLEKDIVDSVTYDKEEILFLLKKISVGLVTPYTLGEVLDEITDNT